MICRFLLFVQTLPKLGFANIARVVAYRVLLRIGYYKRVLPVGEVYVGPFFLATANANKSASVDDEEVAGLVARAERVIAGNLEYFANGWRETGFPPRWGHSGKATHWGETDEFSRGDIKELWEPSRFDGLVFLAQAFCCTKDLRYLEACEKWLSDWVRCNPWNCGPNWKCAQETGLRLMAFVLVCDLLHRFGGQRPNLAASRFISEHIRRIFPTMMYAIAQDNNHATSEAAALYVAGSFFRDQGWANTESEMWLTQGRIHLEKRIACLILPDGSFAQNSLNYHRLMLDSISFVEVWRQRIGDPSFSPRFINRIGKATYWLASLVDPESGDAPNLGANDGARILPLGLETYRDFRTSICLAYRLFSNGGLQSDGSDAKCRWLAIDYPSGLTAEEHSKIKLFEEGGYAVVALQNGYFLFRLPLYRFRPSHADALHIDLWWRGRNLLRDGGSFSYNAIPDCNGYFAGTESHNTVEFDGRAQMPRLSRFLFGAWLNGDWSYGLVDGGIWIEAGYQDWRGASHTRRIETDGAFIIVKDSVKGFSRKALLRWRLIPGDWSWIGKKISINGISIFCMSSGKQKVTLSEGYESRHYGERSTLPVLEVEMKEAGVFETRIELV